MTKKHSVPIDESDTSAHAAMDEANRLMDVAHKARAKAEEASLAVEVNQQAGARLVLNAAAAEKAAREAESAAKAAADAAIARAHHELHTTPIAAPAATETLKVVPPATA